MRAHNTLVRLFGTIAAIFLISATVRAQSSVDIIRGKIVGTDKKPIEGVIITVTSISLNVNRQTRTAKDGTFQLQFPDGGGDFWIGLAAVGYNARKFELKRNVDEEVLIVNETMTQLVTSLAAVHITGDRPKPPRADNGAAIGGGKTNVDVSSLSLDQMGDLSAIASTLPGVTYIPGVDGAAPGFSALGLDPSQNSYLVNGAANSGSLSPDAPVSISVATSPFDVSIGGFSGYQVQANLSGGGNYARRRGRFTVDAPPLQFTDAIGREEGVQTTGLTAGGNFSGPISLDKAFYSISYTGLHQTSDLRSLLNTDPAALEVAGVSKDSAARLLSLLNTDGIPLSGLGIPGSKIMNLGQITSVFDFNPPSPTGGQAFKLAFIGNWQENEATGIQTTSLPSRGSDRKNLYGSISGRHSAYVGWVASETNFAVTETRVTGTPYIRAPGGSVLVNSNFPDSTSSAFAVLPFGAGSGPSTTTAKTASVSNLLRWFSTDSKQTFKLGTALYADQQASSSFQNEFGTFSYNSLADLQNGNPAEFTRNLTPINQSATQEEFAASLGDSWRPTSDLQVTIGTRLDGNRYNETPNLNPAVQQTFGLRNDYVPDRVYASPRVGFSYVWGTAPTIGAFEGSARTVRAIVTGGAGYFQNMGQASLISQELATTGLPGSAQQLVCVGSAVPTVNWAAYDSNVNSIPTQCANGSNGTVFNSTSPNVMLFDPSYWQPRTLRATLNISGPILWNHLNASINNTYSVAQHQNSFVDLNFSPNQQFALANEDNRPVYVHSSSIFPSTGFIAAGDGRVSTAFNQVREVKSDGENEDRRVTFQFSPVAYNYAYSWTVQYTYEDIRDRQRGFTSNTSGNPLDFQWDASGNSKHTFAIYPSYIIANTVTISTGLTLRSPQGYTPVVGSDINGDGYADDRAFVFNPATASDPTLKAGMQTLLSTASSQARTCLNSQLGKIASRNSCSGPWTFSAQTLNFQLNPQKVRLTQRATVQLSIQNPAAAADMMLHGPDKMHGWGQNPFPQGTLLYVRGFDASTNQYLYTVNQRFGSTSIAQTTTRVPVKLSLNFQYNIGDATERQQLMQNLDHGRSTAGTKYAESSIKATASNLIYNPMSAILRNSDSLHLTTAQADSISTLNRWFTTRQDSIWTPVSQYLASLPDHYSQSVAYSHYKAGREATIDLLITISPVINGLLTDEQRRKMPSIAAQWLDPRYLRLVRSSTISPTS